LVYTQSTSKWYGNVFDKGKIVEDATLSEFLAKAWHYKSLWNAQIDGFLPDIKSEDE
jgi:hypothetical protein